MGYIIPAVWGVPRRINQKWPTCKQIGYITYAVWGVTNGETKSERDHMGGFATSPLPSGRARGDIRNSAHVGGFGT